jgi:hypothetical protein
MHSNKNCSACGGPFHPATGHSWSPTMGLCGNCTREFIAWLKERHGKLSRIRKRDKNHTPFVIAAESSIHAPRETKA